MRNILSKEFICSDYKLKQFKKWLSNGIPDPFYQNKVKRYKIEITEIEEDYDRTEIDHIEFAKKNLLKNLEDYTGCKFESKSNLLNSFFVEHLYKEKDLRNLKYFIVKSRANLFNRRILYEFLKEQGLSIYKDYLIPGPTPEMSILIFLKDQDTYNQIKLAFSNDTKISTLWELGL